ncbi:GGDEF domain-containing protein [Pseudobutyrivibrio sp. ACV-2]|uniref:GGDEF domain-containing protein n=1 Tax=Pseudobutyrivibrio sp. ACV-2 TaxID=1520801 RepID=UPI0014808CDF|nr:GGDEF domain-containing protein [Pseudobutyrivibrio sp. ACV-2]
MDTIDDNNLYMLRKSCMYISIVYIFMLTISGFLLDNFHVSLIHLSPVPLLVIYLFINIYTLKNKGQISTAKTAAICCTFYFFLGVILAAIDIFEAPAGQAIWLPIAVIALPMLFIDRTYKYCFEEAVVLSILLIFSYIAKPIDGFIRDLYISICAYVISFISARIILEMRARETLSMKEVTRLSALDKLTHVLNKNALIEHMDCYFEKKKPEESCAMCVIDLDDFKYVNDNLGHSTGDMLLERVGQLLIENFRAYDIVGRYGGDEFVVVMPRMSDENILHSRCTALQMFIGDINLGGEHRVTASIGAVIGSGDLKRETIFSLADDALYKSKIIGKNCCTTWVIEDDIVDRDSLLIMSKEKHEAVARLFEEEGKRFHVIHAANDDEALRVVSRYHDQIKIIMIELDIDEGLGVFAIKYLKQRESFAKIPVIAVVNTKKAEAYAKELKADDILAMDLPDEEFHNAVTRLSGR